MTTVIPKSNRKHWQTSGLEIDLNMEGWGQEIADELLQHMRTEIMAGNSPSGEPNPPLSPKGRAGREARKGLRPSARGFTDHAKFVKSLRVKKERSTKTKATFRIVADSFFASWLARDPGDFFSVEGAVPKVVDRVAAKRLERIAK